MRLIRFPHALVGKRSFVTSHRAGASALALGSVVALLAGSSLAQPAPEPAAPAPAGPSEPAASSEPAAAPPASASAEPSNGLPQSAGRKPRVLSLHRCLELAEANYPKIHEARARLHAKESQLREAHTAPFSELTLVAGAGLVPIWRGSSIYSPNSDAALTPNLGLAYQVGIEGVVPLWTFGKITSLWEAAEANIDVGRHELKKEKNAIRLDVYRAFFGLQLAKDSRLLLDEARKELKKHLDRLDAETPDGDGDDVEVLKARMQEAELDARASEAVEAEAIARSGLRFLTGSTEDVDVPDVPLGRVSHELVPLGRYLEAARLFRPEINMVRAGVIARRAQVELERAKYFPDFGVAFTAKAVRSIDSTDQRNPFAYDPTNQSIYGIGLALRWKLDFLPQAARVAKAEADLEEMRATERFALGGVAVEVEKAFAEAEDAKRRLAAWSRATRYAKQWLIQVQQGIDLGLYEDEDLVEPAKEYALKKFSEMSAIYDYNVAIAALAVATGWDTLVAGEP